MVAFQDQSKSSSIQRGNNVWTLRESALLLEEKLAPLPPAKLTPAPAPHHSVPPSAGLHRSFGCGIRLRRIACGKQGITPHYGSLRNQPHVIPAESVNALIERSVL